MISLLVILMILSYSSSQYNFRVSENRSPNTFVGQILVKIGLKYDFYEKRNIFTFDESNGIISTRIMIDRESLESELVSILVYERQGSFFSRTINVNVRIVDENDNAPIFSPNKVKRTIVENTALLAEISLPAASDSDSPEFGLRNNYQIESGNEDGRFQLIGVDDGENRQLLLQVVRPLDREVKSVHNLTISVQDKGQPPLTGRLFVEIIIDDYNDNSPVFSPSKYTVRINETAPIGTVVVTLHASDADSGDNSRVSYRFRNSKSSREGEFILDQEMGTMRLSDAVRCQKSQDRCLLIVEAYDHGAPSLSAFCYVTVDILRVNNNPPRVTVKYVNSASNVAFIEIDKITKHPLAIFHAVDDDQHDPTDRIFLSLIPSKFSFIFTLHKTYGNLYLLRQSSRTTSAHPRLFSLVVRATDSGSPPKESFTQVNIQVNDRNLHKPRFLLQHQQVTISNNLPRNSFIIRLQAVDEDHGLNGLVTYSIQDGDLSNLFHISSTSGLLTLQHCLLFIDARYYNLTIIARDSGISPLNSTTFVEILVKSSRNVKARFRKTLPKEFMVKRDSSGEFLVLDFRDYIQISDPSRSTEIIMFAVNQNFKLKDKSLFLLKVCSVEKVQNVSLILTHSTTELDKVSIVVIIPPVLVGDICWSKKLTFLRPLPNIFSYNLFLMNLFDKIPLDGILIQQSSFEDFFLSWNGQIFWRRPPMSNRVFWEIEIIFKYRYKEVPFIRNISVVFYRSTSSISIFDCTQLKTSKGVMNLGNFIKGRENLETIFLVEPQHWDDRFIDLINGSRLLVDVTSGPFTISAYNMLGYQRCSISIQEKSTFRFLEKQFYFHTDETQRGSKIGEILCEGNFISSSYVIQLSGQDGSFLTVSVSDWSVFLNVSLEKENKVKFLNILLLVVDMRKNIEVDRTVIFVELLSVYTSAEFRMSSYTFVIPENVAIYTPEARIELSESQSYEDYDLQVISNETSQVWAIFPDGYLYAVRELDYEEVRKYDLRIEVTNKADRRKMVQCAVTILVEDVNDNAPMFSRKKYHFVATVSHCGSKEVGRVVAMDADSGLNGDLEYSLFGMDLFQIDAYRGVITGYGCWMDVRRRVRLVVVATDRGNRRRSGKATVDVQIVIVMPVRMEVVSGSVFKVREDISIGKAIGRLETDNCATGLRYKVTRSDARKKISMNETTGFMRVIERLDREVTSRYRMTVLITCASMNGSMSVDVHIVVIDVNDCRPIFYSGSLRELIVPESMSTGSILTQYSATDADVGENRKLQYRITAAGFEETTIFKVEPHTGILYLNRALDHEYRNQWFINITVFDHGDPSLNSTIGVSIKVGNVNDHRPNFIQDRDVSLAINDETQSGSVLGRIIAVDPDKNGVVFVLAAVSPPNHPLEIDRFTGAISYNGVMGRPHKNYQATVMAIDQERNDLFTLQEVVISRNSPDEDKVEVMTYGATMLPASLFVDERATQIVARFRGDQEGRRLVYSIVNASASNLVINGYTGDLYIMSKAYLDFNYINITVEIFEESHSSSTMIKTFLSTKLIRNHGHSYNLNFQRNEYVVNISESQAKRGANLLRLHALYPGNPIANLEYLIADIYAGIATRQRLPSGIIVLDPMSGMMSVGDEDIDREVIEGSQITIEVVVLDVGKNGSRICSTKVYVNILDTNDNRPRFTNDTYVFHVPEHMSANHRWLVGTVRARDEDLDSRLLYRWLSGNQSQFYLDPNTGEITTTDVPINYEETLSFWLSILVTDGLFSSTANVLIIVDDVNDHGPVFVNDTFLMTCPENVPVNTMIGQVRAEDRDSKKNARTRYLLLSDWGRDIFAVHPDYGILSSIADIDYEKGSHYVLLVTATDISDEALMYPAKETATATVVISIINDNDNGPIFLHSSINISLPEDAPIGTTITVLSASDKDVQDVLVYEIISNNVDRFTVDHLTGTITTISGLDYEETSSHTILVTCSDGTLTATATVYVKVTNTDDHIPVIHNPSSIVMYYHDLDHRHFIYCSDEDHLSQLLYDMKGDETMPSYLKVNPNTGHISRITNNSAIVTVTLQCTDGLHTASKTVTIELLGNITTTVKTSIILSPKNHNDRVLTLVNTLKTEIAFNSQDYKYFIQSYPSFEFLHDWRFFFINEDTGDIGISKHLQILRHAYKFTTVAVPLHRCQPYIIVHVTVKYGELADCSPQFIDTPYLYKIQHPVSKTTLLGTATIKYCRGKSVEYFLLSGHSYFTVNQSNGDISVHRAPPSGLYHYRLTGVVYSTSKVYLSTQFSVNTAIVNSEPPLCQFHNLQLTANALDTPGTILGQVLIRNPPLLAGPISFAIANSYLFSISNEGHVIVQGNLSSRMSMRLSYNVSVAWQNYPLTKSIQCSITIEVVPPNTGCLLYISHPSTGIEVKVASNMGRDLLVFSLPVAFSGCQGIIRDLLFQMEDTNFYIDPRSGAIRTKSIVVEGLYPLIVHISSNTARNTLVINVNVAVLPKLGNAKISVPTKAVSYSIPYDLAPASMIGQMKSDVFDEKLKSLILYSIVSFCCVYPENIAVYNGSIYQTLFYVDQISGQVSVIGRLNDSVTSYTLVIRSSVETSIPRGFIFEDTAVNITVTGPLCGCRWGLFRGAIIEGTRGHVTGTNDVLIVNDNHQLSVSIHPDSIKQFLRYDLITNSIVTNTEVLDFEEVKEIELLVVVNDNSKEILRCPGIVTVLDENDNAPRFLRNYFIGYIAENSPLNTWIVDVEVLDRDSRQFPLMFSLSGDGHEKFVINKRTGRVTSAGVMDREEKDRYNLKVKVSDGIHALETGMLITVLDVNDNAPQVGPYSSNSTIVINTSGILSGYMHVTNIVATDRDDPLSNNSKVFCTIRASNNGIIARKILSMDPFTCQININPKHTLLISPNLTLYANITISDRGVPPLQNYSILRIHFVDHSHELSLIKDTFKHPISILHTSIRGTSLLTLTIYDGDNFENVVFTEADGNSTAILTVDPATGMVFTKIKFKQSDIGSWYLLFVKACGNQRGILVRQCSNSAQITFVISDFNLYAPEIRISPNSVTVAENIPISSVLAKVRFMDRDEGLSGTLLVEVDNESRQLFSLIPTAEKYVFRLETSHQLDYESQTRHHVTVIVHDLGSPSRSQTAVIVVIVTDVDDNIPYFRDGFSILQLATPQTLFQLPLAEDDDITTACRHNKYSMFPEGVLDVRVEDGSLRSNVNRAHWNKTRLKITLMVSSGKETRYGQLEVYIIIVGMISEAILCPNERGKGSMGTEHHILTSTPNKQQVIAASRSINNSVKYRICNIEIKDHERLSTRSYTVRVPNIIIKTNIRKGTAVGNVEVFLHGERISKHFHFNLNGDSYVPFKCLNRGGTIVSARDISAGRYSNYPIKITARSRNSSDSSLMLEGTGEIIVGSKIPPIVDVKVTVRVRETIGNGIVVGRIQDLLHSDKTEDFIMSERGPVTMDKGGVIRVRGELDRDTYSQYHVTCTSMTTRASIVLVIKDENDCISLARKTVIVVNVAGNIVDLGLVTRLLPADNDTVGNYQCRLHSLTMPRGTILTPDCWLYITDSLALSNKSQSLSVIHHDGIHRAVKSLFHLNLHGPLSQNQRYKTPILIYLKLFDIDKVLPKLRLLRTLLGSIVLSDMAIGVNPNEGCIVVLLEGTTSVMLAKILDPHKHRIEGILETEGIEVLYDICTVDTCDFHGLCSTDLQPDYRRMYTDDDMLLRGEIHVYPLIIVSKKCSCHNGYLGIGCNITATCPYQICHNGGLCGKDLTGRTVCECSPGFTGERCDLDLNECNDRDPCGPNGKCANILGGYKCECNLDWSGSHHCNRPLNYCQSNSCSFPGTRQCIAIVGGLSCHCNFGYYGDKCSISSLSLMAQSSIQWDFAIIETLSLEFATISQNAPLLYVEFSPVLKVRVTILAGKLYMSLHRHNDIIKTQQSDIDVSKGVWMKIVFTIGGNTASLSIIACSHFGDCEKTRTIYGGEKQLRESIHIASSTVLPVKMVSVLLGNDASLKNHENSFFVGCVRNVVMRNSSSLSKREVKVLYDSCPRFKDGVSPCGNSIHKCGNVGDCIDEWFSGRCTCPEGYQPPSCSPGYEAVTLSPNTIISFVQRPEYLAKSRRREKREITEITSQISLKIKTRDTNSIILLSFSSLHTFTSIQITNGMIKLVDKFVGTSQHLSHKALRINDNEVHTVTFTRSSSGKVAVTVDSVVAIVDWLQSHDPLGGSVQTIYIAGVPLADCTEELMGIPNFSGCLSEVRFNNGTQPLSGLTERFNVSIVQGRILGSCSSEVCSKKTICGKYQQCREVHGVPNSYWGQYQCINDERSRLLAILTPVFVCIVLCLCLIALFVFIRIRRQAKRRKGKAELSSAGSRIKYSKNRSMKASPSSNENLDMLKGQGHSKPSRSVTSSTLLMQDIDKRLARHPDLIPMCGSLSPSSEQSYYQETSMVNPYISSGQFDSGIRSTTPIGKIGFMPQNNSRFLGKSHNSVLQVAGDSLVYRCSHLDEYEVVSSQPSSTSQDTLKRYLANRQQDPNPPDDQPSHLRPPHKPVISQSNRRQSIPYKVDLITGAPIWTDRHKSVDVFSNNDGSFTTSLQVEESAGSVNSADSGHNVFTSTDSSDSSMASNKNRSIPNSSSCWLNIQRALPPPPPPQRSDAETYYYDDIKSTDQIA